MKLPKEVMFLRSATDAQKAEAVVRDCAKVCREINHAECPELAQYCADEILARYGLTGKEQQ